MRVEYDICRVANLLDQSPVTAYCMDTKDNTPFHTWLFRIKRLKAAVNSEITWSILICRYELIRTSPSCFTSLRIIHMCIKSKNFSINARPLYIYPKQKSKCKPPSNKSQITSSPNQSPSQAPYPHPPHPSSPAPQKTVQRQLSQRPSKILPQSPSDPLPSA